MTAVILPPEQEGREWRQVVGRPEYYVSNDGDVWSTITGRVLGGTLAGRGYRAIKFRDHSNGYVHRIVCMAFHGMAPSGKPEVRHLDGDMLNNTASNLAWGSKLENEADRKLHGTTAKGIRNPQAKLNPERVSQMRALRAETNLPFHKIAARFGVSAMTAHRAIVGVSWND